jgi:multidrug efflux pump subunit AcrA (membrane-fusion protein)
MKSMIRFAAVIALMAAAALGGYWAGTRTATTAVPRPAAGAAAPPAAQETWTCSMHPQIRLASAGKCPICEMPLTPTASARGTATGVPRLELSDHAVAMASIATVAVERRELTRELRTVGKVQYNERSLATITPRVDGYAERLFVDFTGVNIKAGDHLVEVYSPELLVAQQELLIALQHGTAGPLVETAKSKLRLLGLTEQQVADLVQQRKLAERVTLYAPISGTVIEKRIVEKAAFAAGEALYRIANLDTVWAYLDVYEYDLPWIRYGQRVTLAAEALPGRTFGGMVTFVQPLVDEATRTVRVPVHVDNPGHHLKPGMFVSALVAAALGPDGQARPTGVEGKYSCPMHPQVLQDGAGSCPLCEMPLEQIPGAAPGDRGTPPAPRFLCPMKCEGDKTYAAAGKCPVCEMALEPMPPARPAPQFLCPMKCEGDKTYPAAGKCPVCEMALEPVPPATAGMVLAVPTSAVLDSGTRKLAYVEKGRGLFEPRELTVGPRAGDYYPVIQGLAEGERVVARGGFLLDSQFQVTGHPSLFYPGGLHAAPAHQHGGEQPPAQGADPHAGHRR